MKKITIGILAHVDAGKTTLSEALLYKSGQLKKAGRVDHGDSFLDSDRIERDRGITIFSKQARLVSGDTEVVLLDTPGHVDFSAETERTLQVLDYAILVISGSDGVEGHSRTLWRLLDHYRVPVIFFVNKMDLPGTDEDLLMSGLKRNLTENCVNVSFSFRGDESAKASGCSEPYGEMAEELATCSEALLDEYLEKGSISAQALREAIAGREVFPVLFGSALRMEGVDGLLRLLDMWTLGYDGLKKLRMTGRSGKAAPYGSMDGDGGQACPEEMGARVYKINRDAMGGRLTWMKIEGGSVRVKDLISYEGADGEEYEEKIDQIRLYSGEKYVLADRVEAGEVCAVTGLAHTHPGMGLGTEKGEVKPVLEAVMTRAIVLPPGVNAPSFYHQIKVLEEEDPTLKLLFDERNGEIRAQIMGEVQIEVLTRLIEERFLVRVTFGPEKILYKETVLEPVIGVGHFEPLRHYAEVQLLIEGAERGSGITVESACSEDVLSLNWQRLILTHVLECDHPGVLTGSPITDVKITLLTGRAHLKHTEGGDFRQATYRAIRQGLMSGRTALLEPYYHFLLRVPSENLGRALSDLSRMQAETKEPVLAEGEAVLEGRAPVARIGSYLTEVHAYTRGNGEMSLTPDGYDLCADAEAVMERIAYDPDADTDRPSSSVFCAHGAGYLVPWHQVPSLAHTEVPGDVLEKVRGIMENEGYAPTREELGAGILAGSAPRGGHPGKTAGGLEEDAEFLMIYAREFGMDAAGTRMDAEKANRAGNAKSAHKRKKAGEYDYPEIHQKYDKEGKPIFPKRDTRGEFLIVDGYNIIFEWKELKELSGESMDAARGKLLDILSDYQGYTACRLTVVFDAYRTDRTPASVSKYQNLEVVFTKKGETADAYIERMVHEESAKYRITVATSDGLEQLTVLRLGALRMPARVLQEEIRRVKAGSNVL